MREETRAASGSISTDIQTNESAAPCKETVVTAPSVESTPNTSPTFQVAGKTPPRKLKCGMCSDSPAFRSSHEAIRLRRHTNRVHKKTRKVWVTIDTSPNQDFLKGCKACATGKKYNECYNAASHLRRMHFHPHRRGERKMSAAEARRGGKPGDLDPSMEVLKANWLREVDEVVGETDEPSPKDTTDAAPTQLLPQPAATQADKMGPPTPTTPSTRSMAIDSIVDKMDA
ncbi:hypothetical protein CC80DRAFT_424160 [Byssothecium circinans]|uniref:DUF7896 domain-containing protein n=1 Tax=Byssothecium circinans TaxID=147558 RepID=A0A6A5THT1_9PLEO|nr:hypothetical protein CC80DRAFT_424160 [Byssothecium circinans]